MNDKERRDNVFQGESEVDCESTARMMETSCSSIIQKYRGTNRNSTYLAKPNPLIEKAMNGAFKQESNVKHLDTTVMLLLTHLYYFIVLIEQYSYNNYP